MKKTTIKDIAGAAGVSIATVSYILNDVKTQSISDETRVKVLKIAQQLKYVTNRTAQSLKIKKTGLIGILLFKDKDQNAWSDLKYVRTIYKIEQLCSKLGYHVLFMQIDSTAPSSKIIMERNLDGVFIINVDKEKFSTISNYFGFGIPIFVIDSYIEDNLFHKIMPNFEQSFRVLNELFAESPQFLIMDAYNNEELVELIKEKSNLDEDRIYVYENTQSMNTFLSKFADRPGIVINEFLANEVYKTHKKTMAICTCHYSEILSEEMMKIQFELNDYEEIVHSLDRYMNEQDYVNPDKFFLLTTKL
ncbi:LacI family DNA-binding transcriptional regulator [Paenibacillus sp. LMG 31460]|uniref:LacI family DNA-binding transcriptional regulator n=1 Tax=Paenibacillus germinis TaxID=2654979 RepID=A0ABX1YZI5_9BACL|nr:LacI family DNA-binding transcriptional regulator [Paenibacillus germinis]NOU86550.1 LacI family DNA-binding transcriptional regulator [Paenibacillus germinis]